MDDLIGKVLAGESTPAENAALQAWIAQSDANRKYVEQLKTIFEKAASNSVQLKFDTDAAWQKVRKKLKPGPASPVVEPVDAGNWMPLRIAAGILLVSLSSIFIYRAMAPDIEKAAIVSQATVVQDTLPDGSMAFLNKKSELSFEYNPRLKTRKVKLKGEAFFEVKHEQEKPFVIETDEVLIKDLGTAFNVKAYPESNTVEVIVESGEVQIYTLKNKGLKLIAGEKGIYDKTIKEFSKIVKIDTNSLSYKTKVFSFNNTDLGSVVSMLNEVYGVKINLSNDALKNCHLTVNFNNDELETVIDVLAETLNLKVTRVNNEITLEGAGCK